jgi:salicylate hydroxylase
MSAPESPLNVGIVGGGIGGLGAAISLRNAGHKATVYERHPASADGQLRNPLGSAMSLGANIIRVYDRWGLDLLNHGATEVEQERIFDAGGENFRLLKKIEFDYTARETGWPWLFASHASIFSRLVHAARTTPSGKIPININTGKTVMGVDCDAGTITLDDESSESFDLVIVSDGAHSKLIHTITDNNTPAMKPGRTAYRFKIPASRVMADEVLRPVYENERPALTTFYAPAVGVFLIVIETDDRENFYGILMHPALGSRDGSESRYDVAGSKQELNQLAQAFHPTMRRLCELADTPHLWTIQTRDPLKSCVRGRAVAIGDATHPHLPHHGQGAASTTEDAASLAIFMGEGGKSVKPEEVPGMLRKWEEFRLPRARTVQLISSSFPTPIEKLEERIRNEFHYPGPLPENVESHERPIQLWLFQYDVVEEAKKYLASSEH